MTGIEIESAIEHFLDGERRAGKAPATLRNYRADLGGLARAAGRRPSAAALAGAARRYLRELELASSSWNRHHTTLRRFFGHLVSAGVMATNPLEGIDRLELDPSRPQVAGATDVRHLLGRVHSPRDRALIVLLWQTGLRVGEALRLRAGDIDGRNGVITVPPPPAGRRVSVPLVAREAIAEYLRARRASASEPMFVAQGGRPLSYAGAHRLFRQYAGSSGVTMQSLRGRAAAQAFDDGASLAQVQRMLGHRDAANTVRYHAAFRQQFHVTKKS